ncbi:MAG TPA: hypothetical protein VK003_02045 [Oceanobacillus sp.]|nr:hypothetical protein [Oceanobacillus sp.]
MKETQALIERVRRVNDTHQHLELTVDSSLTQLRAGQSLLARTHETWDPYLREQWWPVNLSRNTLVVERPANVTYEPGQVVNLLGIVGQPFKFRRTLRNVLLMAYNTEPSPLLMVLTSLLANKVSVTLLLLGSAANYGTQHLPPEVEILKGDDEMNWPNRVTTVGWADQVFVAVAQQDELTNFGRVWALFNELRADIPSNYLFGVFRPILPCGVGACQACMVRQRDGALPLACSDGPALDLTQVVL